MRTVQFLRNHNGFEKGDLVEVENNEAHVLIDLGVAQKFLVAGFLDRSKNKMATPIKKRQRITLK